MELTSAIFSLASVLPDFALNTPESVGLVLWGGALVALSVTLRARLTPRSAAVAAAATRRAESRNGSVAPSLSQQPVEV